MPKLKVDDQWIRYPADLLAIEEGCYFDEQPGLYVAKFIETFCRRTKGRGDRKVKLLPWQYDFVMRLFGWRRADGTRRFRSAYVEIPKKNGKSFLLTCIALYMAVADGEGAAEVYLAALNSKQARIIFDECVKMIRTCPTLARQVANGQFQIQETAKLIKIRSTFSKIEAVSADSDAMDGWDSSCSIVDELHRQKTSKLWDVLQYAGAAREQPLLLSITTAGVDRSSVCWAQHERALKILDPESKSQDTAHLAVVYAADREKDNLDDPAIWQRANPAIGHTLTLEDFRQDLLRVKESPSQLNNFLRLRLNIWTDAETSYISHDHWSKCGQIPIDWEKLKGQQCYCGLDLSSKLDLTAFVMLFPQPDGSAIIVPKFWLPQAQAKIREATDSIPYSRWCTEKLITLTPGAGIDPDMIEAEIKGLSKDYKIRSVTCDDWGSSDAVAKRLRSAGIKIAYMQQGFRSMSEPTKELEKLAIQGKLIHGNNSILSWNNENAVVKSDATGNIKLVKPHSASPKKIDGLIALIEATDGWIRARQTTNIYSKQGVTFVGGK